MTNSIPVKLPSLSDFIMNEGDKVIFSRKHQ